MSVPITAALLYDLVACPHRVSLDLFADARERDPPNPFVELLWERGSLYEREVISKLEAPFLDLSRFGGEEKERRTWEAMQRGEPLIYSARLQVGDLLGHPDLLRREGTGYLAGDIKSGSGEEGPEESSKPKVHYAVQLALYTDILEQKRASAGRRAFVWDVHGREVVYDFQAPYGKRSTRTLWQIYEDALSEARGIVERTTTTTPAFSAACKLCHWYTKCVAQLKEADDLTTIPELGRSKRDVMRLRVQTVAALASANLDAFVSGQKSVFPGIGPDTLRKFQERAKLLADGNAKPYLRAPITLPNNARELFFDVEVDPMRGICYLHGFVERQCRNNSTEKFVAAFVESASPEAEKLAFAEAWQNIKARRPCTIYYYSKYERTIYRALQEKYPDICHSEEVEELFDAAHAIDLYGDVVREATEWPTWDYSVKTLATYLGFAWRDKHPSGAASIEWFHRWIETSDPAIRQRILEYNEDDCRATRVLRDAVEKLPVRPEGAL